MKCCSYAFYLLLILTSSWVFAQTSDTTSTGISASEPFEDMLPIAAPPICPTNSSTAVVGVTKVQQEDTATYTNKRVVFIHTDLLGSPMAETDINGEALK